MDWDFIVHRIFMIYLNVAVILSAYFLPKKYIDVLKQKQTNDIDTFEKVYISIGGLVVIFVLSIAFATKYQTTNGYLMSQLIIFAAPYFIGLSRAFRKDKNL